jgi:hypothetical protein
MPALGNARRWAGQGEAAKARFQAPQENNMMLSIGPKWVIVLGRQSAIVRVHPGLSRTANH